MSPKGRIIIAICAWLCLAALIAVGYKLFYKPHQVQVVKDQQQKQQDAIFAGTSGTSHYDNTISFALDSFSGYSVVRSPKFAHELANKKIKLVLVDDGANYAKRMQSFKDGSIQMGVFTVDAFIKACADQGGNCPATMIALVDETRGADSAVGYTDQFPNIDSLDNGDVKFVLATGSPSETLARVVMSQFHLNNLSKSPFISAPDAKSVYEAYRKNKPDSKLVYVLWEPYVSKALQNPNMHVIVDSSQCRGYIVDVIAVNRDFLFKNPDLVKTFVECYLRAVYQYKDEMTKLVQDDAKNSDTPLTDAEADHLVKGVWWKNTSENFAQMGLSNDDSLENIEDIISNITRVLVTTGAITSDPTNGHPNQLYYDGILKRLHDENFHPGIDTEHMRNDKVVLAALNEAQWRSLTPVGQLDVPPLVFGRGTATLTGSSTDTLVTVAQKLKTWPAYYLVIKGNSSGQGDAQANADLAKSRAQAAVNFLTGQGIDPNRIHAVQGDSNSESSVTFVLGQLPY